MTKKLLTLIHYSNNFVICMIFNSLPFICTIDSIGYASHLQMGIYRSKRHLLAAPQENSALRSPGRGPYELSPVVLLCSGREGPAGPGIRNLPLNSWNPCRIRVFLWLLEILETNTTGKNGCFCHSPDGWKMTIILQESTVLLVTSLSNHLKVVDFKIQLGSENPDGHASLPVLHLAPI